MENIDVPEISEQTTGLPFLTLGLIIAAILVASFIAYRWFKSSSSPEHERSGDRDCEGDQCQME